MSQLEYMFIALGGMLTGAVVLPSLAILLYDWWQNR